MSTIRETVEMIWRPTAVLESWNQRDRVRKQRFLRSLFGQPDKFGAYTRQLGVVFQQELAPDLETRWGQE